MKQIFHYQRHAHCIQPLLEQHTRKAGRRSFPGCRRSINYARTGPQYVFPYEEYCTGKRKVWPAGKRAGYHDKFYSLTTAVHAQKHIENYSGIFQTAADRKSFICRQSNKTKDCLYNRAVFLILFLFMNAVLTQPSHFLPDFSVYLHPDLWRH